MQSRLYYHPTYLCLNMKSFPVFLCSETTYFCCCQLACHPPPFLLPGSCFVPAGGGGASCRRQPWQEPHSAAQQTESNHQPGVLHNLLGRCCGSPALRWAAVISPDTFDWGSSKEWSQWILATSDSQQYHRGAVCLCCLPLLSYEAGCCLLLQVAAHQGRWATSGSPHSTATQQQQLSKLWRSWTSKAWLRWCWTSGTMGADCSQRVSVS
jgi:hypothetical protein